MKWKQMMITKQITFLFLAMISFFSKGQTRDDELIIKEAKELVTIIKETGRDVKRFNYKIKSNGAYVYKLKKIKKIVVIPASSGLEEYGFMVNSEKTLKGYIDADHFPIKTKTEGIFEKHYVAFQQFDSVVEAQKKFILENWNIQLEGISYFEKDELAAIDAKLPELTAKDWDDHYMTLIVLTGEILKTNYNGAWKLDKQYGVYNPFLYPGIQIGSRYMLVPKHVDNFLHWGEPFSMLANMQFMQVFWNNPNF